MPNTYRAILHGDRIEWSDEEPESISPGRGVPVFITLLDEISPSRPESQGSGMAAALERIAAAGGPTGVEDPLKWERALRKERPLPASPD